MNYIKQFRTSLIVLGLFLTIIPSLCYANGAIGFFTFPPIFLIFAIFMVLTIESLVINNRLDNNPRKALLASFIINLCSTILGFVLSQILPSELISDLSFISWIILLFVGTVIVEGIALSFFYSKSSMKIVFATVFLMNLLSYIVLFSSGLIGSLPVFGTIVVFVIMIYLLRRFFGLFETTKESPSGEKISVEPGTNAFNLILFFLIILLLFGLYIDSRPSGARLKAKDARIIADVSQLRAVAEIIKDNSGSYENLCYGNKLCINKENCSNNNYDTETLIKIDADLKAWMPSKRTYNCFATADNYCISAALNEKGYYCVDSNGFYGKTKNLCASEAKCP